MASELSEAIARGVNMGVQKRQVRAQESQAETARINAYTSALSEKRQMAQQEADLDIKKRERDLNEAKFNNEVGMQLLKGLSMKMNSASPTDRQVFYTSDPGKAILKEIKQRLGPGFVNEETGEPLLMSDKELFEGQIAQMNAHVSGKILRNEPLSPGEQNYAALVQSGPRGFLNDVFDSASKSLEWQAGDAETRKRIFQGEMDSALGAIKSATGGQPQESGQQQQAEPSMDDFLKQFRRS